jgi:hypothetical protein
MRYATHIATMTRKIRLLGCTKPTVGVGGARISYP